MFVSYFDIAKMIVGAATGRGGRFVCARVRESAAAAKRSETQSANVEAIRGTHVCIRVWPFEARVRGAPVRFCPGFK